MKTIETMDAEQAVKLLSEFVAVSVQATIEGMTKRGTTKRTWREVNRVVTKVFAQMTGRAPTAEELKAITD